MVRIWIEEFVGRYYGLLHRVWRRKVIERSSAGSLGVGLNVGSAYHAPVGWVNIDRTIHVLVARIPLLALILYRCGVLNVEQFRRYQNGQWSRVRFWDVQYPLPFADESFHYVYSSHVIEHLAPDVCHRLLSECYRVLKAGGILRLVVPDLYLAAGQYVDGVRRLQRGEISDCDVVSFLGESVQVRDLTDKYVGQCFESDRRRQSAFGHVWMYDFLSLSRRLKDLGFESVERMEYRRGRVPDLEVLDVRPTNSLHLEAVKPMADD